MQLLACIGEQFNNSDEICGVVVNIRTKQDKVSPRIVASIVLPVWPKLLKREALPAR